MSESVESDICAGPMGKLETRTMRVRERNAEIGLPSARVLAEHAGEWVAIVNRKIVASGKNARQVLAEGRARSLGEEPSMLRVPTGEILLL